MKEQSLVDVCQAVEKLAIEEDLDKSIVPEFNFNAPAYVPLSQELPKELNTIKKISPPSISSDKKEIKKIKKTEELDAIKSKLVDEAKELNETVNIVFIGHVDAGKSTIGGHILYLTGMVDKRTLEKYEKEAKEKNRESWYLSWALDTNSEERDKGKTVEVGRAHFETKNKKFVLLDAPGHRGYVPNMIGGTVQADIAILVISARKGEFETGFDRGGQTREHAQIARISGVKQLIVVVNKMDDYSVAWSQTRYNEIQDRLTVYLKKIGWKSTEMYFMPISGFTGANIKDPVSSQICSWWMNKPSFLEYLENLPPIHIDVEGDPLVIINEKFKGIGIIVTGKVIRGCFSKNDSLTVMPIQKSLKLAAILSLDDKEKNVAKIGENVRLKFFNAEDQDINIGYVLCHPSNLCPVGKTILAQLVVTNCKSIICAGYKAIFHIHNAVTEATLVSIRSIMDRKTHEWMTKIPKFVKQDSICMVRLSLSTPNCVAAFSDISYLGRFSLRDEGKTVAFGKIIKVLN